jgi:predicted ATPase/class 3 adenylate cyclase
MAEELDPEEVGELLQQLRSAASQVIGKHDGTINQFIGDEVMALFGIPNAREDDPVRAIRAVLELHVEIGRRARGLQSDSAEYLAIHSGINTGLIMAQYRNDREGLYRLTGDTVNTAARLRSLAAANEVLIGPATQRLVRPYFELERRASVSLKGKTMPLTPYRVLRESNISSRFDAARARGFKSHVGRDRELETLRLCVARALEGEGQLVTVEGEPGIGKSRLIYEFVNGLDREQLTVAQARCHSHGSEIPYFPFLNGLRRSLDIGDQDDNAGALAKAVSAIKGIDPALERFLPYLLHLLGIRSEYALPAEVKGEAVRKAMEDALVAIITMTTRIQPMVLVIEDWHWSDVASQSALRQLLRLLPSYRLMVIVSYRSEYVCDLGTIARGTSVRMKPFTEAEVEDLIKTATGTESLPRGLGQVICQNTDGNPLFVEEVCYSLLESEAVTLDGRNLVLQQPLDRLLLPDTVQAVIRARLDRLDDGAKALVGHASVIGRTFTLRLLERVYGGPSALVDALDALQAQEIIRQTRTLPEPEYAFRHVLAREVAYDTLLQQQRRQLHEAVGLAMEEMQPERSVENAAVLAYHFARSSRTDRAVAYALQAGRRAAELYANTEAATYFNDALSAAGALPPTAETQAWQIDAILGLVSTSIGPHDLKRDQEQLRRARGLAESMNDRRRLTQVLYWLGRTHYMLAELDQAIELGQRSLDIADEIGDPELAAPLVNLMARVYSQQSDIVRSAQMMERSVEQMRVLGNRSEESSAAGYLSALLGYLGEFDRALRHSERSIQLARELKNPYAEAASFHYRGVVRDQQGRWDQAIADFEDARKIAEAVGDTFRLYLVKFMAGRARQMLGDQASGRAMLEQAISLATKIGTTFMLAQAKSFLAACHLASGDHAQTRAVCASAIDLAEKTGDRFAKALAFRTLAECMDRSAEPSDRKEAARLMLDAVRIQEQIGAKPELARSYASLSLIFKDAGDLAESERYGAEATRRFQELGLN